MSKRSSHIGCCIPVVTTIIADLAISHNDLGIKTMKRDLKKAMEDRFQFIEYDEKYTIATFLDPRFKWKFFRYVCNDFSEI